MDDAIPPSPRFARGDYVRHVGFSGRIVSCFGSGWPVWSYRVRRSDVPWTDNCYETELEPLPFGIVVYV